jgi:hypothetical protein
MKIILDLPRDHFAACSFLRQSLALSLIHEHALFSGLSKDNLAADLTERSDVFTLLATRDPDACVTALREAARIGSIDSVYASQATELLVNVSTKLLFDDNVDIEVQDAAQEVLVNSLSQGAGEEVKKIALMSFKRSYLPSTAVTPLFGDKRLILQGALLNYRARDGLPADDELAGDFEAWVPQVRRALQDSNVSRTIFQSSGKSLTVLQPFDTRYAAAIATQQLDAESLLYLSSNGLHNLFLEFCLAVYDLCNDDDIEIRTLAAPVATSIINLGSGKKQANLVPLAAAQGIAEFISSALGSSESAALTAITRATGNAVNASFPDSVRQALYKKFKSGSSLFAQEKHNLFIDESREARIWSSVAARLDPSAFPFRLLMNLSTWVTDGLDVLISESGKVPDAPLGWSREAEVFVLGMQILYAAQLVLVLIKRGVEMPIDKYAVDGRLKLFVKRGEQYGMNVLWVQTAKEVLEQQG